MLQPGNFIVKPLESPLSKGFLMIFDIRSLFTHVQLESQIKKEVTMVDRGTILLVKT